MRGADVLLVEDGEETREFVDWWLNKSTHRITREATTREEALEAVKDIADETLPCDVVVLDGNLGPSSSHNEDAREVVARIRELGLGVKIIDFASIPLSSDGIETDAYCNKGHLSSLSGIIDEL